MLKYLTEGKKVKNVYIILTQTGTVVARTLKLITRDEFNHASICVDDDFSKFYSFGRLKINNPLSGGFVVENAFSHVLGKFPNVPCMILKKEVTDEQYEQICKTINKFVEHPKNYKYDFINLFLGKTPFCIKNKGNRFFCSGFVEYVLDSNGIKGPNIKEKIRPYELSELEGAEIMYQGELKEWCSARYISVENKH